MTFKERVAPFITLENATVYSAQTDKYLWVAYNILDVADCATTEARVNWVEDQFDNLLAGV